MQIPPPAPTAQGSFAKTPFPHLLVYALERALSGTIDLRVSGQSVATLLFVQGMPAKVRTNDGLHLLGDIMVERGLVSPEAVRAAQARMAERPRLQGQILIELGAIDEAQLEAGVRAQLDRKLEHLFGLPSETDFAFFDGVDALSHVGGPPTPIDPLPSLWRGVQHVAPWTHVEATLRRVGSAAVRIAPNAQIDRFDFTRIEAGALDLLRQRPMRVADLTNANVVGPSVAQLLIYVLVITKQVDLVEVTSPRLAQQPAAPAVPQAVPPSQGSEPTSPVSTNRSGAGGAGPASGRAFARVQLQAKPIQRTPLIVEEGPVTWSASDGRIASPMPQAIPLTDMALPLASRQGSNRVVPLPPPVPTFVDVRGGQDTGASAGNIGMAGQRLDIGSMFAKSLQSSVLPSLRPSDHGLTKVALHSDAPPTLRSPRVGSLPPPSSPKGVDAASTPLTTEQLELRQKILERAEAIAAQDYFEMLGLPRDATSEMVQKAFFALAKVWHPDRLPPALVDVKDACSKVFTHLTEAQATLCDAERRAAYMTRQKDGGSTPDDQAKILAILDAATEFQKAEFFLKRNDVAQALERARKAYGLDSEQADYLAMITWLEAQKPEWGGRDKTLQKIAVLDRCIKMNANSERAYFWRGMLYKRIDETAKAVKDFKKAADLNPRNLDALREVRLHNIRGGQTKPPPSGGNSGGRPSQKPPPEPLGGLFGKLFKK